MKKLYTSVIMVALICTFAGNVFGASSEKSKTQPPKWVIGGYLGGGQATVGGDFSNYYDSESGFMTLGAIVRYDRLSFEVALNNGFTMDATESFADFTGYPAEALETTFSSYRFGVGLCSYFGNHIRTTGLVGVQYIRLFEQDFEASNGLPLDPHPNMDLSGSGSARPFGALRVELSTGYGTLDGETYPVQLSFYVELAYSGMNIKNELYESGTQTAISAGILIDWEPVP